ncbi:hypothetical protein [Nocardioides pocheonensis]|nr:hypothetical protein [Nocardioides pocheonensis]
MRNRIATLVLAVAVALVASPLAAMADSCCDPASDAMATQDPSAYSGFVFKPCKTRTSVNCYRDVIGHTGEWGQSYWRIRVGKLVCVKYWDAQYDRRHGHCERRRQ